MWEKHEETMRRSIDGVNMDGILLYLGRNPKEVLHRVDFEQKIVMKAIRVKDEDVLIRVTTEDLELVLSFPQINKTSEVVRKVAAAFVDEWFDLERDLQPFYDLAERDEILKEVVAAYKGLRVVGVEDVFEALCWSIMGQQISLHVAYALKQKLVTTYGKSLEYNGETYWLFPTAAVIDSLQVEDLRSLSFTQRKAEYVIGVAELIATGKLRKDQFIGLPLADMEKLLTSIRGIGKWSANYVIMRCFRHPDAFPLADVGLHNALKQLLGRTEKPSMEEIEKWSVKWEGWRAYATFYLWRTLQS